MSNEFRLEATNWEWQEKSDSCWVLGPKVRGIVRETVAEIAQYPNDLGGLEWNWIILAGGKTVARGKQVELVTAVEAAEEAIRTGGHWVNQDAGA